MRLTIIYNKDRQLDQPLDKKIIKSMRSIGFIFYASGCNHITGARDLAFTKED